MAPGRETAVMESQALQGSAAGREAHNGHVPSSTQPQLEVDGVAFSYPDHPVLHDVSVSVERGEFAGIVGPNGSGKSTLLRVMDGVAHPQGGVVRLEGADVRSYTRRELARRVALVPQTFALDFDFSVIEVVEMGHYCRREGDARESAESALETLGIDHLAKRLFPELSGGEKQMVVLAQALAQQPDALLLDEPVSALDVSHQLEFFECLQRLNADGLTVVCVLHDLNLALHYCRSLLMLTDGTVAAWGFAGDVLVPETIESVYGVDAHVHRHAGRSFLTFSPRVQVEHRERVHVVCGGGTGAALMRVLAQAGFNVSAGVVNALDADEVTGREMGLPMAVEAAFTVISDEAQRDNLALVERADLLLLTDVPIGRGNSRNLDAVRHALERGAPVWMVAGIEERDYTGGAADLDLPGARRFETIGAMIDELQRRGRPPAASGAGTLD